MPAVLICESAARMEHARELAARLGIPMADAAAAETTATLLLVLTDQRLELRLAGEPKLGPVYVDFLHGALGYRQGRVSLRGEPLARAAGLKPGWRPRVLDATAGLGRDAFVLAALGCEVTLIERSPLIAALLEDGLARAREDARTAGIIERMHLLTGDARTLMAQQSDVPDVICLDPMYPHREQRAQIKKEMRVFRAVVGDDPDAAGLLDVALATARQRVVVKRPAGAEPLGSRAPALRHEGKSTRFDVYLT
ncbi:MAG: class I SAM-dependent methyltransferase, partial [Chromatiales bacterium]|nr:class I SAM-dependent methyltransferase [Chromatiales bacterium]